MNDARSDIVLEQAEKIVIRDEPPSAIRRFFPSTKESIRFYGEVRARQFDIAHVNDICSCCQRPGRETVAEFRWQALFSRLSFGKLHLLLILLGHLSISIKGEAISFSTFHAFCRACWGRYQRRKIMSRVCDGFAFISLLAGLFIAPTFGLMPFVLQRLKPTEQTQLFAIGAGGLVLVVLSIWLRVQARSLSIPASLRHIAPRPFILHSATLMKEVSLTPQSMPQAILVPQYRPAKPNALSWQQIIAILVAVFVGLPAAILGFGGNIPPDWRLIGRICLCTCAAIIILLTALHFRRQKRIRAAYYEGIAAQAAIRS